MFFGTSIHPVDEKARVFVPKRFQERLGRDDKGRHRVVVTRGFEGCLFLFSEEGFAEVLRRLQVQTFGGKELRTMQRLFFSNTHETQLDASGRLVLPEKLRVLAGIEPKAEVAMVGAAERAEIWNRAAWEAFEASTDERFDELSDVLVGQGELPPQPPEGR